MCTELLAKHPKECASVKTYREPCTLGEIFWAQGYVYFWAGKGLIYALHNSQFALVSCFTAIELHYGVKHTQNIVVEHIDLKGATVTEHRTCALIGCAIPDHWMSTETSNNCTGSYSALFPTLLWLFLTFLKSLHKRINEFVLYDGCNAFIGLTERYSWIYIFPLTQVSKMCLFVFKLT